MPSWGSGGGGFATVDSKYKKPTAILSGGTVLYENASSEQEKKLDGLSGIFHSFDGTGDFVGLSNAIRNAGGTASDLAFLYGFSESDVLAAMDRNGIPRFEDGGLHAGGLRLVGERGWEIEATGPARYWNQEQLGRAMAGSGAGADFGLLAASIDRLEQRLGQLEMQMARTANNTAKLPEFAEQFDAVTGGGQMMRTGAGGRT